MTVSLQQLPEEIEMNIYHYAHGLPEVLVELKRYFNDGGQRTRNDARFCTKHGGCDHECDICEECLVDSELLEMHLEFLRSFMDEDEVRRYVAYNQRSLQP